MLVILTVMITTLPLSLHATGNGPDPHDTLQAQIDSLKSIIAKLPKGSMDGKFEKIDTKIKSIEALLAKVKADQQKSTIDQQNAVQDAIKKANAYTDSKFNDASINNQAVQDSLKAHSSAIATLGAEQKNIKEKLTLLEDFKKRVGTYVPWSTFVVCFIILSILSLAALFLAIFLNLDKKKKRPEIKEGQKEKIGPHKSHTVYPENTQGLTGNPDA